MLLFPGTQIRDLPSLSVDSFVAISVIALWLRILQLGWYQIWIQRFKIY